MSQHEPQYLEVAVAAPVQQTLTYAAPVATEGILPGQRLLVPLGNRLVTGYLLEIVTHAPPEHSIKAAADVLDDFPLFPANMVPFFRWIAGYYHYPLGELIKGALPSGLAPQSGRQILLTDKGREHLTAGAQQQELAFSWLPVLLEKGALTPAATRKIWRTAERRTMEQWAQQGLIEIRRIVAGQTTGAKTETCVQLNTPDGEMTSPPLSKPETKTLTLLRELSGEIPQPVPRKELAKRYSGARKALTGLQEKGLVGLVEQHVYRDPFGETPPFFPEPAALTAEQEAALNSLLPAITQQRFAPFLLHGVTGSGKTEIYLKASRAALETGKGVLVLVPEIALATQLEGHFFSRFGDQVALLHSGLTTGERYDQWLRVLRGEAQIVIGARSAIFAPLSDPGLIIVDEEHDSAYKQEDGLRYHARDLAVLRASLQGAAVILGSATPSIISYHHAQSGKYQLLSLHKRIENRPMPRVEIVDLQKIQTVSGRPPLFSPDLTAALRENLAKGDQSLIFLNRRGFANLMLCKDCGHTVQCRQCQISLTLHKGRGELLCHYCGYKVKSNMVCANCQSKELIAVGFGTERLEEEIRGLFPQARIARLDRDTTTKRKDYLAILRAVHQGEIDILIGTQMITKGHHFPNVTLVGIVWADAGLGLPDFKAGERTFQLLSQVTGRAGRGEKPGRVIVQTHQPEHYSVVTAQSHDYEAMVTQELELRGQLQFPPFSRLVNLRLEGTDEDAVRAAALELAQKGKQLSRRHPGISVLGPSPAPLSRLRGKYRWQLLLKGQGVDHIHHFLVSLVQDHSRGPHSRAVKLSVDVDPENML